jgi:hypothetical protein
MDAIKDFTKFLSAQIADANIDNLRKQISETRSEIFNLEDVIEEEEDKEHPRQHTLQR